MFVLSVSHKRWLAALVLIVLLGMAVTFVVVRQDKTKVSESTELLFTGSGEGIAYTDLSGKEVLLTEFLGRVLVVTTWASWSPFSQADLVAMNEVAKNYSADDVVFLAINRKETKEQAQRFALNLPTLEGVRLILDPNDFFYQSVSGYAMPETIIFDQQGAIVEHGRGTFDSGLVKSRIDGLVSVE
jgi:thiol-disulfide isomerase/thioredoxin